MTVFFFWRKFWPHSIYRKQKNSPKKNVGLEFDFGKAYPFFNPFLVSFEKKVSCLFQYFCPLTLCFFPGLGLGFSKLIRQKTRATPTWNWTCETWRMEVDLFLVFVRYFYLLSFFRLHFLLLFFFSFSFFLSFLSFSFFFHFLSSHNFFIYFYFHVFHFLIELKSFLYFSACQFGLEKRASLDFFHGFNMSGMDWPGESSMVMLVHNAVA